MSTDPKDTQPQKGDPKRSNRHYVPATWTPPGSGGGHPKTGGGYEQSKTDGAITTRGLNRKDQRYTQPAATLQASRDARALAEYATTVVLQGALGLIELRSPSGNNYDLDSTGRNCDCPDRWRLNQSGYPTVTCKHENIATMALGSVGGYANLDWSVARLAEAIGVDERTAANLCADGTVIATKVHNVWVIPNNAATHTAVTTYQAKMVMPTRRPEPPP